MAKKFSDLVARTMSPERVERSKERVQVMLLEMDLQELRQHCTELTQKDVADLLKVTQAHVSKFERREDILLSTLYSYVKALGGELELRVRIPGSPEAKVTQFDKLGDLLQTV